MNFHFNEEEQEILNMLEDFAAKEVGPRAQEVDEEERFPIEAREQLAEMGMMGIYFPEEYNGSGLSYMTYIGVCEKLAEYCATTSIMEQELQKKSFPIFLNDVIGRMLQEIHPKAAAVSGYLLRRKLLKNMAVRYGLTAWRMKEQH